MDWREQSRALGPILADALAQPGPSVADDVAWTHENTRLSPGLGQLIGPI
jgi:hypothetical protein